MKTALKLIAALAAIAGAVYVVATYGDRIVAWAKKVMSALPECPCCKDDACTCTDEDVCDCTEEKSCTEDEPCKCSRSEGEPCKCESTEDEPCQCAAEEAPVEAAPVADEADFEA